MAMTVNAAHVVGTPDRGWFAPGLRADVDCSAHPTGATSRTTWPAISCRRSFAAAPPSTGGNLATMPTRKQRRRREKDFRHDVRVYEVDEEGNEVPIAELRAQDERAAKPKPKSSSKGGRPARVQRDAQPPSWDRALKRGGMMGGLMVVALYFVQARSGARSACSTRLRSCRSPTGSTARSTAWISSRAAEWPPAAKKR